MKLAILSRNRSLHSIRRLVAEAKKQRIETHVFDPLECQVFVGSGSSGIWYRDRPLPDFDVVIPRIGTSITDYGLAVVKQLENMGVRVLNGTEGIAHSRDKLRCLQILASKGFAVPNTVLLRGSRGLKTALRQVQGTPAVFKRLQGTQGLGVMLLESASSAESVLDTFWGLGVDVIVQQYIAESRGTDYRIFVIGNRVVGSMKRQARAGEFRSNIHRGGEGFSVELPAATKRIAIKAVAALGLSVAGVDILDSIEGPKIIEVNSSPGFEGLERATKLNIASMIVKHAAGKA
jgi:ribosomal protein S6--L-glutamate ligase